MVLIFYYWNNVYCLLTKPFNCPQTTHPQQSHSSRADIMHYKGFMASSRLEQIQAQLVFYASLLDKELHTQHTQVVRE